LSEPKNYGAIMLSSTFTDLKEHRQRAIEVIQKLGYFPRVMEFSGAQAESDVIDVSLQMVRDAVAYVGVISLKYGQTPVDPVRNPKKLSVTELEFNEAMRLGRPIVLFIMGEEHPVKKADIEVGQQKLKKLDQFRQRAKRMREGSEVHRVYETFDSLEVFSTDAATALGNLVRYIERVAPPEAANTAQQPPRTISNIPINIPFHFVGDLSAIGKTPNSVEGRAAISVLHGLRGVGKTTLAATYAVRHRDKYRATWWVKAETEATMRADLVSLGVRLGWVAKDAAEAQSIEIVLDRLGTEGKGILLVYDNAIVPNEMAKFLPRGSGPRVIVTSNAPNWGKLATPVEIEVWSNETGADFLVARTGRATERAAALALSEVLGGLPLAHEQAAAYCERVGVSLAEYKERLKATPAALLDSASDAVGEYHSGLTVTGTFALAIEEAAKRHPAADALITYAALLAPEPIPLYFFLDGRERFGEPLASALTDDGLDEAVAALRTFALTERETVPDERDPAIATNCIHLHRLVRQVASARRTTDSQMEMLRALIDVTKLAYPEGVGDDPSKWPRARRLDAIAHALVGKNSAMPPGTEVAVVFLLNQLAEFRQGALGAYGAALELCEFGLAIAEEKLGKDHPSTALCLSNIGFLLEVQGNSEGALKALHRSLEIREKACGKDHPDTASSLNNIGGTLQGRGEFSESLPYHERALKIRETVFGPEHPTTAISLFNIGSVLEGLGDRKGALEHHERALGIREKSLGRDHPHTADCLCALGRLQLSQGDIKKAREYIERELRIIEKALDPDHPSLANALNDFGDLLVAEDKRDAAQPYYDRALLIFEKVLGSDHPNTAWTLSRLGYLFYLQGNKVSSAKSCYDRAVQILENNRGTSHLDVAEALARRGLLLRNTNDLAGARKDFERALAIAETARGSNDPNTISIAADMAPVLDGLKLANEAAALREKYGLGGAG
jgi:tetratricopeptide (TPR) repeat protein